MGFFMVMQDSLVVPYRSEVLGMDVTVEHVELNAAADIVANKVDDDVGIDFFCQIEGVHDGKSSALILP